MYFLEIIPINSGLKEELLSYFSSQSLKPGTLVEIKIKNRIIFGIVYKNEELKNKKLIVKKEKFLLKKIEKVIFENFINEKLLYLLIDLSILFNININTIIETLIPKYIYNNLDFIKFENKSKIQNSKKIALIGDLKTRNNYLDELIKKENNKKTSTLIFYPTIYDIEIAKNNFNHKNIVCFHSNISKKDLNMAIQKIKNEENLIILSTPSLLPFLIKDKININTIVLEKENSNNYFINFNKKEFDFRNIIKKVANLMNINIILSGNLLSINSFLEYKNKILFLDKNTNNFEILDIKKENKTNYNNIYFSEKLIKKINLYKTKKAKIFLFVKRKGLFTETICGDCNTILACEKCDKPLILYRKNTENNLYICNFCKNKLELKKDILCKKCNSWKMNTLGIATEGVDKYLKELGFKTFVIDSSNIKTKKDILKILESWQNEKDLSILIGTELALNFLNKNYNCDFAAIISIDSLFSIPEINIDEKIFNIILEMKEKINTKEKIIIQTRLIDQPIWKYIKEANVLGFLENELKTRKILNLPPYSNILKWTLLKKDIEMKISIEKIIDRIFREENIEKENVIWRIEKKTGNYIGSMIIKKEFWEKEEVLQNKKDKNKKVIEKIIPTTFAKKTITLLSDFKLEINPSSIY